MHCRQYLALQAASENSQAVSWWRRDLNYHGSEFVVKFVSPRGRKSKQSRPTMKKLAAMDMSSIS
jgi:hypothetical protein